jgi:nucleotidyltransferase substrate binding protein (TIGR01987 family)
MVKKMLNLYALEKTTASLEQSLKVYHRYAPTAPSDLKQTLQAGVIQNFEFTYEVCWKLIKRWLADNIGKTAVEGLSRQELFRLAAEYKLIDSVSVWMQFHRARNETSHTYDPKTADDVFEMAEKFLPEAKSLLLTLSQRINDE